MADNVVVTAGSGTTIAADEVADGTLGTVKVQYVKIMDGTLDGTSKAAVGANGLKVDGSGVTQPVSGSLTTVSTVTNLSQMGGVAIALNTGARSTGTQRVTIATDDVVPASQSGTWTVQPGNTPNTTPWLAKISDGTNAVAVKASSTAPVATDPALVVAISPNSVNANGSAADSSSAPVAFSTEGKAQLGSITETAPATDTASSGLNGRLQRVAQRLSSLIALMPTALGTTTDSASSPVAFSTEGKAQLGSLTETAPASDTASSGLNGRLQRVAQRITSMIALLPTALGSTTSSASLAVVVASDQAPVFVKGNTIVQAASSTITRPADTTAYTIGDLVSNSVTAGSVTNLQFTTLARVSGGSGVIVGAQIQKTSNVITSAAFRLHLFNTAPTYTSAGDNSALATVVVASAKGYLGYVDITTMVSFSDVAWGSGAPDNARGSIPYVATAQIIYALVEARGAYTPTSAEVFTISLDALQD